jgi:Ca-activated chloride channel homolog
MSRLKLLVMLCLLFIGSLLSACGGGDGGQGNGGDIPQNAIEIDIIYAPESALYMPQAIEEFNQAYREGRNPVTGQALQSGERPIFVRGAEGSSGTVMQGIVNAIIAPNNQNVARPVIFEPSVSHWLALANFQSGRELFDLSQSRATALAPVVMAIWESRLEAIRDTVGYQEIGWEELLQVLDSPNGWQDYGLPGARRQVYYGHTDPFISSTGLSTLIAEFYASARENGFTGRRIDVQQVNNEEVQNGVREIEQLIRHYSRRTTEFKEYIAQGTEYLDFVALEENDLIYINEGKTEIQPPEKLVALYPKEGTFWHEHPMGIVNADWVTEEQQQAANVFIDYILTEPIQRRIMEAGFRPANPNVPLAYPFVIENGVDPNEPATVLDVPDPEVIATIQQSWAFVKKQADVMLLIDVSGSMETDGKLEQAKEAAIAFAQNLEAGTRLGLSIFSDDVRTLVPLGNLETNLNQVTANINSLRTEGGTELFASVRDVVSAMNEEDDPNRIRAVVILSDGADTGSMGVTLNDALRSISDSRESRNPVIVIPVAYGSDADINALNSIARTSATRVQSGDPGSILGLLEIISSYF